MERWNEVFSNEELTKKIVVLEAEEAQKVLAESGYDFSLAEIKAEIEVVKAAVAKAQSEELGEDDLEDVAGGVSHGAYLVTGFVVGVVIASCGW